MANDDRSSSLPLATRSGRPGIDHGLIAVKAILASFPIGATVASLLSDYIPDWRVKRAETFLKELADDLAAVEAEIDTVRLMTEDYGFLLERGVRGAADFPQKEKRDAFRGILVNSLITRAPRVEEEEFFLTLVERLSSLHIRMLRFMDDPRGYLAAAGIPDSEIRGGFSDFFPKAIPGVDLDIIISAFASLRDLEFTRTGTDIFNTSTSAMGLALLGNRLTPLAKKFVAFCRSPAKPSD